MLALLRGEGRWRAWVLVAALVVSVLGGFSSPVSAASGSLGGTVVDGGAVGVSGVTVDVFEATWGIHVASTSTGSGGTWGLSVPAGSYRVRFLGAGFAERWSGNASSWVTSSAVVVPDGGAAVVDVSLLPLDVISGTVVDPGGVPVGGITVELLRDGWAVATTATAVDGSYEFASVAVGTYTLGFRDPGGVWATQYSGGSNTAAGASTISAMGGGSFVVDHTVHRGGTVTGRNGLGASGPGVAGVYAVAIDADTFEFLAFTPTAADGSWVLANLPPGEVKVATVDLVALGSTPSPGYRIVMRPSLDVVHLGLGPAYAAAKRYTVVSDATTATGRQPLVGFDCNPATLFPGASLVGANLSGKNLRGCDLHDANLADATVTSSTRFDWANLAGVDLSAGTSTEDFPAAFTGADVTGASIMRRSLSAYPVTALTRTQLLSTDHDWTDVQLTAFDLSGVDFAAGGFTLASTPVEPLFLFIKGSFENVNLTGADFAGMDLTGVRFIRTNLTNADLTEANLTRSWITEFAGSGSLAGARLTGADLSSAIVDGWLLLQADRNWSSIGFTGTTGLGSDGGWILRRAVVDLTDVDWAAGGWNLTGAQFAMVGTSNPQQNLSGGTFAGMDLTGATLAADLRSANLLGVTGMPSGGGSATYGSTICPDGTVASPSAAQKTCVGHGLAN